MGRHGGHHAAGVVFDDHRLAYRHLLVGQCPPSQGGRSRLDDLFEEDETFEAAQALAIKDVVVWQHTDATEKQSPSKARLAFMLKSSRSRFTRHCEAPSDSRWSRRLDTEARRFQDCATPALA